MVYNGKGYPHFRKPAFVRNRSCHCLPSLQLPCAKYPFSHRGFKVSLGGARFFGPQDALESTQHSGIVQHTARISMVCMVQCGMWYMSMLFVYICMLFVCYLYAICMLFVVGSISASPRIHRRTHGWHFKRARAAGQMESRGPSVYAGSVKKMLGVTSLTMHQGPPFR